MSGDLRARLHESGHQVIAHRLGYRLGLTVVRQGPRIHGFAESRPRDGVSPLEAAIDDVTVLAAGRHAESIALLSGFVEPVDDGDEAAIAARMDDALGALTPNDAGFVRYTTESSTGRLPTDEVRAEEIADRVAADERGLFLAYCGARAARLVWADADVIAAYAVELTRRPILDGPSGEATINAAREERTQ